MAFTLPARLHRRLSLSALALVLGACATGCGSPAAPVTPAAVAGVCAPAELAACEGKVAAAVAAEALTGRSQVTMMVIMQCSVAAAKAKLSELIRSARAHNEVIITDRGRPVARLVPYEPAEEETIDDRFRAFRERGLIVSAAGCPKDPWPEPTPVAGALARFLADRDEP